MGLFIENVFHAILASMGTQVAANVIGALVVIATFGSVVVSWRAIVISRNAISETREQARENWEHAQQLAMKDRHHQILPIMVPKKEIYPGAAIAYSMATGKSDESLYTSEHRINWAWNHPIIINLHNMGNGLAFNLHCVLYGSENTSQSQFVSWDNGPIEEKSPIEIILKHSSELRLFHDDSVDGKHPLYDMSLDSSSNPWISRIACLTITYHDLFGTKYVSIFHYTLQHQWIRLVTEEIIGTPPRDLKELDNWKLQQAPKWSAPAPITSQAI